MSNDVSSSSKSSTKLSKKFFQELALALNLDLASVTDPKVLLKSIFDAPKSKGAKAQDVSDQQVLKAIDLVVAKLIRELDAKSLNEIAKELAHLSQDPRLADEILRLNARVASLFAKGLISKADVAGNSIFDEFTSFLRGLHFVLSPAIHAGLAISLAVKDSAGLDGYLELRKLFSRVAQGAGDSSNLNRDRTVSAGEEGAEAKVTLVTDAPEVLEYHKLRNEEDERYELLKRLVAMEFVRSLVATAEQVAQLESRVKAIKHRTFSELDEAVERTTRLLRIVLHPSIDEGVRLIFEQRHFRHALQGEPTELQIKDRVSSANDFGQSLGVDVEGSESRGGLIRLPRKRQSTVA